MGPQQSELRQALTRVLAQYGSTGVDFCVLVQHFGPGVDRPRISMTLANMRNRGQAHSKCNSRAEGARWFIGPDENSVDRPSSADYKYIQSARQKDRLRPIVFFGDGLIAPRCVSVWTYARSFKECA
jgi:hypothetical protein